MNKIDAIILAGGEGRRLQPIISDVPKPLANINGRPFLDILLGELARSEVISRVVMAIGYKSNIIIDHYSKGDVFGLPIQFSCEEKPLGTGGALLNAVALGVSDPVLVMNGDSFLQINIKGLVDFHRASGWAVTMSVVRVNDTAPFGSVVLDEQTCRLTEFSEKNGEHMPGLVNGGVYIVSQEALLHYQVGERRSLEREILPELLKIGIGGYVVDGSFFDIGTPESYAAATEFFTTSC